MARQARKSRHHGKSTPYTNNNFFSTGTAISTYTVEDKKQVAEFDVQQWLGENPEEEEEETNPCPICNSAEREDILLLCDSCDAAYHTHCIGLDYIPDGDWYCMECAHLFDLTEESQNAQAEPGTERSRQVRRPVHRGSRARTRARLRRARRQARNVEWQGAWGQFSGRFYEMSDLDLDNHDEEDEDLEHFRRFQLLDFRELQRWQQRMNIANRLGARDAFAHNIPPQISEQLQPVATPTPPPPPPVQETRDERRAWGALEVARAANEGPNGTVRKRKTRSATASPAEPVVEPERKLKRPRTRRLPIQGETSTSASSPAAGPSSAPRGLNGSSSTAPANRGSPSNAAADQGPVNGSPAAAVQDGPQTQGPRGPNEPALVSALLKELEPSAQSEDEISAITLPWRNATDASSPAISPSPSNHSSPRALSLTPPPLPRRNGRPTSPTLSLSTHIEPVFAPANYSPNRYSSDHSDSESRVARPDIRTVEIRQPRPRRPHRPHARTADSSPTRMTMTQEDKKNINDIVKMALRPHWRAQKLTTEQYASINRDISRKLYEEVKDASLLDEDARRQWEKRASQAVAQAVSELQA